MGDGPGVSGSQTGAAAVVVPAVQVVVGAEAAGGVGVGVRVGVGVGARAGVPHRQIAEVTTTTTTAATTMGVGPGRTPVNATAWHDFGNHFPTNQFSSRWLQATTVPR
jgi:hypothetical protein